MSEFAEVLDSLRRVRGINPFFALDVGRPDDTWLPGTALLTGPALKTTIDAIAVRYRAEEPRVAASLFFLSYTARLLSPLTAVHKPIDVRPENLWWRHDPANGLSVRIDEPRLGPPAVQALEPVVAAIQAVTPVARGLLWGNAMSNIAGALKMVVRARMLTAEEARERGEQLMSAPPFEGAGEFVSFPGEVGFVRRSCCLYYRVAAGGKCGDCPLVK
ncbi:Ferric iron reductase protein FhuF, involved in iron transport [Lentzea xinjiangensis]|uniref:Ferric iron reductase protein FhuF, involved in iron transport n=1 Tax=Lentzea xinjiangensis TaxID=402600 RepID=A0A1H9R7G2_9PSEU|nr:(2Fe-2S)-binding protein [Lentzea xinjiangensis]SER68656.1 Ferric iron reductase protein FhuF, involved in iron transport [Lentzea xinjiangensis]